jgi:hypothetical protein
MADETWAAKVSLELKEEIGQLVKDSGLSSKEFLEQLISQHKIQRLQGNDSERHEDIQQVTYHLDKIKTSFISLVEKGIDLKGKFNESLEQESILHKSMVDQQQIQIKLAQEERDKAILDKSALESLMKDISARNEELENNNKTYSITIQMQQEKVSQLEDRVGSVQAFEDELNLLKQQVLSQTKRIEALDQDALNYKRELELAQALRQAQEKESAKEIEQIVQVHLLEIQRATLETEKKLLGENQKIREEYFLKIEALTSKNQELTERLHQIQLDQNKTKTKPAAVKEKDTKAEEGK